MRALTAELAMAMALVSGCCGYNVPRLDEFSRLPLREQMAVYDQARRKDCVIEPSEGPLFVIARHGYEAADAMTASLNGSGAAFPPEDAITVLELVHFGGADLRQHEAFRVLEELARAAPDAAVRKRARLAVDLISKNDPLVESSD
jgi:hypothetical protein